MKTLKLRNLLVLAFVSTVIFTSCLENKIDEINSKTGFDFKTVRETELTVSAFDNSNNPLSGVPVSVYSANPLNADGTMLENAASLLIYKGQTTSKGEMVTLIATPTYLDSVVVFLNYIGLPALHSVKIDGKKIS